MRKLLGFCATVFCLSAEARTAEIVQNRTPSGTYAVALRASPDNDFVPLWDAPWKLEVTNPTNLKVETIDQKDLLPGYVLEVKATAQASFDYKLTAYFCNGDKTECRRTVFQGRAKVGYGI